MQSGINEIIFGMLIILKDNYDLLNGFILDNGKDIYLGSKEYRKCRFCKKGSPEVTFKSLAHAIPEFVGNKQLFSYYECDSCNSKFASLLETHMGDYMNIDNTLSQVKGKKGVPSYRPGGKKSRIDMTDEGLRFQSFAEDSSEIFTVDEQVKKIIIDGVRSTYVPIGVFKCLCKMALTIIDESELIYFSDTIEWLLEESHCKSKFNVSNAIIVTSAAPRGRTSLSFTGCRVFKRKQTDTYSVPYMIFILEYREFTFQISLPLCSEDVKLDGLKTKIVLIPSNIEMDNNVVFPRKRMNFSSCNKVKGEKVNLAVDFGSIETTFYDHLLDDSLQ